MAIWDVFTGRPAQQAAEAQRGVYQGATSQIGNLADFGRNYTEPLLRSGYAGARDDLSTGYGAATGAVNTGAQGALGYLDAGQQGAMGRLDAAHGAYQPLTDLAARFGRGTSMYDNALGLGGAGGTAAARDAFSTTPGYGFQMDQGLEAINRRRNAAGSLTGGNADRDAQVFGQGLASQEYNKWLDRLSPYNQYELGATGSAAQGNAALDVTAANLLNRGGETRAGVATGQGNSLADLANRYYGAQAGLDTGEAGALTGNAWQSITPQISAQQAFAQPTANSYMDAANAQLQGSKAGWNLGTNLLTGNLDKLSKLFSGGMSGGTAGGAAP